MARGEQRVVEDVVIFSVVAVTAFAVWIYLGGGGGISAKIGSVLGAISQALQGAFSFLLSQTAALRTQSASGSLGGIPGVGTRGGASNIATVITGTTGAPGGSNG